MIKHCASTPYHPQTNGMVERVHKLMWHFLPLHIRVTVHAFVKQYPLNAEKMESILFVTMLEEKNSKSAKIIKKFFFKYCIILS